MNDTVSSYLTFIDCGGESLVSVTVAVRIFSVSGTAVGGLVSVTVTAVIAGGRSEQSRDGQSGQEADAEEGGVEQEVGGVQGDEVVAVGSEHRPLFAFFLFDVNKICGRVEGLGLGHGGEEHDC